MVKPIGGRGKKAPYETMQMRVPIPVKPLLEAIIERFRNGELIPVNLNTCLKGNEPLKMNTGLSNEHEDEDKDESTNKDKDKDEDENSEALNKAHANSYQNFILDKKMLEREVETLQAEINSFKVERQKAISVLGPALKIKAGNGGQIKDAIREAFPELSA